jgi:hypothetical protein
MRQRR